MKKGIRLFLLLCLFVPVTMRADEEVRQVQEELRKRNLYFGDIDGRATPELANSLNRYQERKGFPATGEIDDATAASLGLTHHPVTANPVSPLPDVPVLKSDRALASSETERIALEKAAEEYPSAISTPPPPAESPSAEQNLSPAQITSYVQQYLRDGETADIPAQTKYFTYPVRYFDHGMQGPAFVTRDVRDYVKRWPDRKYSLLEPVTFAAIQENETRVEFVIDYRVQRGETVAKGRTRNTWIIRPEGKDLKILSIKEQRLRE
ncbi:MAG: peptidoglycan-binding domain-containing protein [Chthoniobacterales bacterium]